MRPFHVCFFFSPLNWSLAIDFNFFVFYGIQTLESIGFRMEYGMNIWEIVAIYSSPQTQVRINDKNCEAIAVLQITSLDKKKKRMHWNERNLFQSINAYITA